MIPWLLIVDVESQGPGLDGAIGTGTHEVCGLHLRFDGVEVQLRDAQGWRRAASGEVVRSGRSRLALLVGAIEEPDPGSRSAVRLPSSGQAAVVVLAQNGPYRGCFFGAGKIPAYIGKGATVSVHPKRGPVLYTGEDPVEVDADIVERHHTRYVRGGQRLRVGGRDFLLLTFG